MKTALPTQHREGPERALVRCEGLTFRWPGAPGPVLENVDFRLQPGERVLLRGASGAGKSTFLNLLAGILVPTGGTLTVADCDLRRASGRARDQLRASELGVIFQQFNLLPFLSVLDNVLLPLRFSRQRWARANAEPGGAQGAAGRLLEALGLSLHTLAGRTVAQLSVGQQQRVAAARALLGGPRLVLADEPTSALDPENRDAFLKQLEALQRAEGCALLCVSHDPALAPFFDRTVALKAGPGALGP